MDRCPAFLNILTMLLVIGILGMFLVGQIGYEHLTGFFPKKFYSRISQVKRDLERNIKIPPVVPEFDLERDEQAESQGRGKEKVYGNSRKEDTIKDLLTKRNNLNVKDEKNVFGGHGSKESNKVERRLPPYSKKAQKAIERLEKFINS